MVSKTFIAVALALFMIVVAAGCVRLPDGGPQDPPPVVDTPRPLPATAKPEWVLRGSGAFNTQDHGNAFYGVGTASRLQNQALLRATADNSARREAEQVLTRFVRLMAGSDSQVDASGFMPLVQTSMQSAAIQDHWTDPQDGRFYSLCRVDLGTFKQSLARFGSLEMAQRHAMLNRADQVFNQMAAKP